MSTPGNLKELYSDEMKDLWSANDQMARAVKTMAEQASDSKLREMLEGSVGGINKHAATLKGLLGEAGATAEREHCKGMEGLVKEALKHTVEEVPTDGRLLDIEIIAHYQRMSHYGLAGFGTAAAYANALGMKEQGSQLKEIVDDIYQSDHYATKLAEETEKVAAVGAA